MKNYRQVFPDYIQSTQLIQNDLGNVVDIAGSAKGFGYNIQAAYVTDPTAGTFSMAVVKGDYAGTRMITTLTKTYGFDGIPEGGTKIHTELKLKSSGFFSALSFVNDEQIKFGIDNAFDKFITRAKVLESGKIPTTTTPINTPPITEPPVTTPTKPPVTTQPPVTKPPVVEQPVTKPTTKPPVTKPTVTKPTVTEPTITASTDKSAYKNGDMIVISGSVKDIIEGTPLTIWILDSNSKLVQIDQFTPAADGSFSKTYVAAGPLWELDGTYTVKVQYGSTNVVAETNFQFNGSSGESSAKKVHVDGTDFDVNYIIKNGSVVAMKAESQSLSLNISIQAINDGSITITLPRELIDAKTTTGNDDSFFVLIDGSEVDYKETRTAVDRTLSIAFLKSDSTIKIIGTHIAQS